MSTTRKPAPSSLALALLLALALALAAPDDAPSEDETMKTWSVHEIGALLAERQKSGRDYLSFLRVPALHAGVYVLAAGGTDLQSPHGEDEVYYVLEGRAGFRVDGEENRVKPGDVIYVKAGAEHRFHSIEEDLKLLVFFSTADSA